MPRGDHFRKVTDDQILAQLDRDDLPRPILTPSEIADLIGEHEEVEITGDAVRQRLIRMKGERVESEKMGGVTFWRKKGVTVFADGGSWLRPVIAGLFGASGVLMLGFILAGFVGDFSAALSIGMGVATTVIALALFFIYASRAPERVEMWLSRRSWGRRINRGATSIQRFIGGRV